MGRDTERGAVVPAGQDRHPALLALCSPLHDVLAGGAAGVLLATPDRIPEACGVWVAPSWLWTFPRLDVGRTDRAADGSRVRMPIRLEWSAGVVSLLEPDRPVEQAWTAAGLGHTACGVVTVVATDRVAQNCVEESATGLPTQVSLAVLSRAEVIAELHRLVERGTKARWEALSWLDPHLYHGLRRSRVDTAPAETGVPEDSCVCTDRVGRQC